MPQKSTSNLFCLIMLLQTFLLSASAQAEDIFTYSQLRKIIKNGQTSQIQKIILTNGESAIDVQMTGSNQVHSVIVPRETRDSLINDLDQAGVDLEVHDTQESKFWISMFSSFFLPILLLVGFLFMFRTAQNARSIDKSNQSLPNSETLKEAIKRKIDESSNKE